MNQKLTKSPFSVTLPDDSWIKSTHTNILSLQNLPESEHHALIFVELQSRALLSVSQLWNQGCKVKFTEYQVSVDLKNQTILAGPRDKKTVLYTVPLATPYPTQTKPWVPPPTTCQYTHAIPTVWPPTVVHQAANNAFTTKNIQGLVPYLHGACFRPVVFTLVKAINAGNFAYWLGLTDDLVNQASTKVSGNIQRPSTTTTKKILVYQKETANDDWSGLSNQQ